MSRTARTSCFKTLVKVRLANIAFFSSITCATGRLHLDLKVGFIHCVLFHLQSIASMFPLVSQRISMEAPETSSHTLVSPSMASLLFGSRVASLFPVVFHQSKKIEPWTSTLTGFVGLTFHVDLAVRDGPLLGTAQHVVHPSLRGTHCDLTDLFQESQVS